jgi:N-acetylmuramic acid 6-phosphate etherase
MKILVEQNPVVLSGSSFQFGVQDDSAGTNPACRMRRIACRIAQIGAIADANRGSVEDPMRAKLGCEGQSPYNNCMDLAALLTEQANPVSAHIDKLSTAEMLSVINGEDGKVAAAVSAEIPRIARAIDGIVDAFRKGGRLFYIGAGTSGRLGVLDAAECPPTFNVSPDLVQGIIAGGEAALSHATEATEDEPATGVCDLRARGFREVDVLCGIAASGRTPYVLGAIDEANRLGALTIGISCTPDSELARRAKIAITPLPGPEIIAGSTRMKAGTATKLVLNMLTTGSFIRLGYVWRNLMINVQPKNSKLLDRSRRIVAAATGVSYKDAEQMLAAAGNNVREAITRWEEKARNG